jgi:hypothetical protein
MERKVLTKEQMAQRAIELLDEAETFEEDKNWPKAIENYQRAADYLNQSGYLQHRIDDIYTRMTELNNLLAKEKGLLQQTQAVQAAQAEEAQEKGFILLDDAKKLESSGRFQESIQKYMDAISFLAQAGWTDSQLENLQSKIQEIALNIQRQQQMQQQGQPVATSQPAQVMSTSVQPVIDQKAAAVKSYEARKIQEEDMQNQAFSLIDEAKSLELQKNYDGAIDSYQKAIGLLNTLGWAQQTQNLQLVVDKLRRDKEIFERAQSQRQQQVAMAQVAPVMEAPKVQETPELREKKLIEFESKKRNEEEIQTQAFNLIDNGKRLERKKDYDEAISEFQKGIELLKSIGWDSYIHPVINFINDIKSKKEREIQAEQVRKKREDELQTLQKTIQEKQKEQFVESSQEQELKRIEFEKQRAEEAQREKQFYETLDLADKTLREGRHDEAISEYSKALDILKALGPVWDSYVPSIQRTISSIQEKKQSQIQRQADLQKKQEIREYQEEEFQLKIVQQINIEREKLKHQSIEIKQRDDEVKYREERKEVAFQFLDSAQKCLKQGELDKAIYAYQNAGNVFAEIQWTEEIPLIENAIKEIENKQYEQKIAKQKQLEGTILRTEQEKEFQKQIARQLQQERDKLRQKEIALREYDEESEYREKMKEETLNLLEEGNDFIKKGEFDKAIDIYRDASFIFAEIQWHDQIDFIEKSIIEIENMKRDAELRKQMEMQRNLEREKQATIFQEQIAKETVFHRNKLKQKEITLRELEKEREYREERKEEAFKLLDDAQNLLNTGKFDEALEIYHNVASMLAEIQWTEEIPLIQNAIREIENKKQEKAIWKHKKMEETIHRETTHQEYVARIKHERDLEKAKLLEKQAVIEKQRALSAQAAAKQQEAFKMIDEGDNLFKQGSFDQAIDVYQKSITILTEIGWEAGYLKLLQETLDSIKVKKEEKEKQIQIEQELLKRREQEEHEFQSKITLNLQNEKERMKTKKIEIQKREARLQLIEKRRDEAFDMMDQAQNLLNQGQYDQSIETYRQAELVLSEIQFPTDSIKEMIYKVLEKKKEKEILKQQQFEAQLKRQQEGQFIQQQIADKMSFEEEKMKTKQIQIKKQEELKAYMETRKAEAFTLLDEAETYLNRSQYDEALEYYNNAELILREIQFPTESITEAINKVREKKREQELLKQKEMEVRIHKEKEEIAFQKQVSARIEKEKDRMRDKRIQIQQMGELKAQFEKRRDQAFSILEDAESFITRGNYDRALECYRRGELLLNEIQYPTDSVKEMITRVINLKKQKEMEEEMVLQRRLEKLEEEKALDLLIEERQKQEREKKTAQHMAIQEKERIVQEQMDVREASYALLEEASKYLKQITPDYDKAISLYVQARNTLAENIGWEPEINNLNSLINDLQQEKVNFLERKRLEEQAQLERQEEYEIIQEEIKKRQVEAEKQQQKQRAKLKAYEEQRFYVAETQDLGMSLIDEAKTVAKYHQFEEAYNLFNQAIEEFKEIGWTAQIRYIEHEINNTKELEQKANEEVLEIQRIQEVLLKQKESVDQRREVEDQRMKAQITEVRALTGEISGLIHERRQEAASTKQQQQEKLQREALDFGKSMGKMLQIKQELRAELEKVNEAQSKKEEDIQKQKEQEEVDEITRMIREAAKKDKK